MPAHGSLALNSDGSFLYIPDAGFTGADSFTYTAKEGAAEAPPVAVTIAVNSHVLSARADSYSTEKNNILSVAAPGVLDNDTDANSHSLTAITETPRRMAPLTLNTDGSFIYTPDKDYSGTDSFTYKAHDGAEDSAPATVDTPGHRICRSCRKQSTVRASPSLKRFAHTATGRLRTHHQAGPR